MMNKNKMEILGVTLAGMMVLSSCAVPTEKIQTPTVEATSSPTPTSTPIPTATATPEATPSESVGPEDLVTVKFKSVNLDENIKAWQEGRLGYKLMVVTEKGWGEGLGLVVDLEKERVTIDKSRYSYFFQGVYLGRETINLKMSEEMANPENILMPDNYKVPSLLAEDLSTTFKKMADRAIGDYTDGVDYTVAFMGMQDGKVIPVMMGYEVEGKNILDDGLATYVYPDVTDGKFYTGNQFFVLNTGNQFTMVNASTSLNDVKVGQAIAFRVDAYKPNDFYSMINTIESMDNCVNLNYLMVMLGENVNSQALADGNLDALAVSSGENLTWQQVVGFPYVSYYFSSGN